MPILLHKRSTVSGAVPAPEELAAGELAVNLADKKWFLKKDDGTVVCINNLTVLDGGLIAAPGGFGLFAGITSIPYISDIESSIYGIYY